ncbi:MAG: hypothetical protein ACM3S1_09340 [Hyphomicrobiales bacterium]
MDLGDNRQWLVNSHMSGTARRDGTDSRSRIEALLIYRDQLMAEIRNVEGELRALAPTLHGSQA